jgi:lysophospholipase L1-like esterase
MRVLRAVVTRVALMTVAGLLALAILEVGIRLAGPPAPGLRGLHELRPDRPWLYGLRPHAVTSVGGIRYAVNGDGFRDHEYARAKAGGAFRVVVLGDSIAFGWGVPLEETFPKILETRLRTLAGGRPIEVLNLAVSGYNPYTEAELFRDVGVRYQPDLVLVQFCINDLNDPTLHFDNSTVLALRAIPRDAFPDPTRRLPPPGWCRRFRVCAFFADSLAPPRPGGVAARRRAARRPATGGARVAPYALSRDRDGRGVSGRALRRRRRSLPSAGRTRRDGGDRGASGRARERRGLANRRSAPGLSRRPRPGDGPLFVDFYHPSPLGHRVAADALLSELGCRGLLPAGCSAPPP